MTIGNSRPLALCTVIMRTPSLSSSRIGASDACAVSAATRSSSTKPRNEMPPPISYCRASSAMCSTLASACSPPVLSANPTCARVAARSSCSVPDTPPESSASVAAAPAASSPNPDRTPLWHVVAMPVQALQQPQRFGDRPEVGNLRRRVLVEDLRHSKRMEAPAGEPLFRCGGRSDAPTRAAPRRQSRRTGRAASQTPTARRPATRWR